METETPNTNNDYQWRSKSLISVCSHCFPGHTIFDKYPRLRGLVDVSHGICAAHRDEMMNEFKRERQQLELRAH